MRKFIITFLLFIMIFWLQGCLNQVDKPEWKSKALTPLAKTSFNIMDIIPDSLSKIDGDNSITLVYQDTIYKFSLKDLVNIEFESFKRNLKINEIKLGNKKFKRSVTLADIADNLGLAGLVIKQNHGNTVDSIETRKGLSLDPRNVNANEFFETITFKEGKLKISIENNFPVDLENIEYRVKNKNKEGNIVSGTFSSIPAGEKKMQTKNLAGKMLSSDLQIEIINYDIIGKKNVLIDTTDAINTSMRIFDISVKKATAIFPAQNLIDVSENAPLKNMGSLELEKAILKKGVLGIDIISTVEDSIFFTYKIPDAIYKGNMFLEKRILPPAPPMSTSEIHKNIEITKPYEIDLTGKNNDTNNVLYNHIIGRIDSTGELVHLSLQDSIDVIIRIKDFLPRMVEGFIGKDTITVGPEKESIGLFNEIEKGSFDLDQINLGLSVVNGMGFKGSIKINELKALNNNSGMQKTLKTELFNDKINVDQATKNKEGKIEPGIKKLNLNKQNSNIDELVEILPGKFQYNLDIFTFQEGMNKKQKFFAEENNGIYGILNAEIPLSFETNDITLKDTVDFISGNIKRDKKIESGTFKLLIDNYFPLTASIELFLMNNKKEVTDTISFSNSIQPATSENNGKITKPKRTKLEFFADKERIDHILKTSKMIMLISFSTIKGEKPVQLYNTYDFDIKLVGNISYTN